MIKKLTFISIGIIAILFLPGCTTKTETAYGDGTNPESGIKAGTVEELSPTNDTPEEDYPTINSLSKKSGSIGDTIEIQGSNLNGFEGDLNAWIEDDQGIKGILYGLKDSTSEVIKITLESPLCQEDGSYSGIPCENWLELDPGNYHIYVEPWGKESNKVEFSIVN